jgi:hypothetical protein
MDPTRNNTENTWATYWESRKSRNHRKELYRALQTYFENYCCENTKHSTSNITCIINCKYRTAANPVCSRNKVCFRYVIVNTLPNGGNK